MSQSNMILDPLVIESLSLQARMSKRALGRAVNSTSTLISAILDGRNHADLTIGFVSGLADALGVHPSVLFVQEVEPSGHVKEDDVRRLGAALVSSRVGIFKEDLAEALGWKLDRVAAAGVALDGQLAAVGLSLQRNSNGWKIQPSRTAQTWQDEMRLEQVRHKRRGLHLREMEILRAAFDAPLGGDWERRLTNADRVAFGGLLKSGLLERTDAGIAPSERCVRSLSFVVERLAARPTSSGTRRATRRR